MIPRLTSVIFALVLIPTSGHTQSRASMGVTGRVSAAFQIEPVSAVSSTGATVHLEQHGASEIRVAIDSGRTGRERTEAIIVFALRTNAPTYQITAATSGTVRSSNLGLAALGHMGSGTLVTDSAVTDFQGAKEEPLSAEERVVGSGTRISTRGRFSSPDNAILVEVRVTLSGGSQAIVTLRMGTYPHQLAVAPIRTFAFDADYYPFGGERVVVIQHRSNGQSAPTTGDAAGRKCR